MPKFSDDFSPILLEGMTATLFGSNIKADGLNVICIGAGALPEYVKDWSTLTTVTWSRDNEDTNLEMPDKVLAQLRMRILDDFKVEFNHPGAVSQWRTNKTNFYLRQWPEDSEDPYQRFLWKASEFFIYEDATPRFDLYSEVTRTQNRIAFSGWRFKLQETSEKGRITIWVDSWPPGK